MRKQRANESKNEAESKNGTESKNEAESKNERYLLFEQLITRGVVYEEYEEFEHSVFSDVYDRAFELVKRIVEENRKYQDHRLDGRLDDFEWEISNIISFIGRRGTGKTSALVSFGRAMLECSEYAKFPSDTVLKGISNIPFYSLKCVNASMLKKTGDIFVLILANMVERLLMIPRQESVSLEEYENRSILQKAGDIYEDYLTLKETGENAEDGYSSLERLKNIASSQGIRNSFAEFVQMYLERMNKLYNRKGRGKDSYLVISIDDIDVSRPSRKYAGDTRTGAYDIMYSLQQYLSVPNVIVLVSYNHINLYNQILEHFYTSGRQYKDEEDFERRSAEELATQFMEKTFPINMRLYMPSWRKRDFENEYPIRIEFAENQKKVLKNYQEEMKTRLSVKDFILALMGEKTGVYFDVEGRKKHFLEPDNLRSLCNFTEFLLSMHNCAELPYQSKEWFDGYKYNMSRIKEDIYFRHIREKLSVASEMILMEEWLEDPIDRRSEKIVRLLSLTTEPLGKKIKIQRDNALTKLQREYEEYGESSQLKEVEKRWNNNSHVAYSYAELVHSIFHMTRDTRRYSRDLVGMILYSYTVHLTETYQLYLWNKDKLPKEYFIHSFREPQKNGNLYTKYREFHDEAEKYYSLIRNVVGAAVCGRWAEYFFPEVYTHNEIKTVYGLDFTRPYVIGYVEKQETGFKIEYVFTKEDMELPEEEGRMQEKFGKQLSLFLFMALQQTELLSWTRDDIVCSLMSDESGKISFRLEAERKQKQDDLDLTACFKYTFCYAEVLSHLERIILGALERGEQHLYRERSRIAGLIRHWFDGLWDAYYEWDQDYGNMMVPLYNLDIMYNLIKRVFQECGKENMASVRVDEYKNRSIFLEQYRRMLERFLKRLEKIDAAYCLENGFAQAYSACPYMKMVVDLCEDPEAQKQISAYITSILRGFEVENNTLIDPVE